MSGTLEGIAVGGIELPYLDFGRDRWGRIKYIYFRRNGQRWELPADQASKEFTDEYWRLRAMTDAATPAEAPDTKRSYTRGQFGALVNDFLDSSQFKTKSARTKGEYRRIAEGLQAEHGVKRVHKIERRHVRQIRDAKTETPGAANNVLRMLKILLNFAVDDGLIRFSPAARMKELPVGEWRAWTDKECEQFEKRWAPGTMQRRAYAVALYTGQRKQDQITRARKHREDGGIYVVQSKTGEELWTPEHRELTAELARGVAGADTLLFTPTTGEAFDPTYYGSWFADAIEEAGLPDDCVLHGLRKCAARKLAELGLSEKVIQSITGHVTARMIQKYTKGAEQRKLAKRAMKAWEKAK
jgi:integrase